MSYCGEVFSSLRWKGDQKEKEQEGDIGPNGCRNTQRTRENGSK